MSFVTEYFGADDQVCVCVCLLQEGGGYLVSSLKCREAKYALKNGHPVYT